MKLNEFIKEVAADDDRAWSAGGRRGDAEFFLRYVFFWVTSPVWGVVLGVHGVLAWCGRKLR